MGIFIHPSSISAKRRELGKYYLLYTCPGCGSEALSEQTLVRETRRSFVKAQEETSPELYWGRDAGRDPSAAETERAFRDLERQLEAGDWSPVEKKVRCRRCKAAQSWSGMGKPWRRTALAVLTAAGLLVSIFWVNAAIRSPDGDILPALCPLGVTALLSLGYVLRRNARIAAARRLRETERPEVFGPDRLRELAEGPYANLVKPYLKK